MLLPVPVELMSRFCTLLIYICLHIPAVRRFCPWRQQLHGERGGLWRRLRGWALGVIVAGWGILAPLSQGFWEAMQWVCGKMVWCQHTLAGEARAVRCCDSEGGCGSPALPLSGYEFLLLSLSLLPAALTAPFPPQSSPSQSRMDKAGISRQHPLKGLGPLGAQVTLLPHNLPYLTLSCFWM